jgi:hypothetical protein
VTTADLRRLATTWTVRGEPGGDGALALDLRDAASIAVEALDLLAARTCQKCRESRPGWECNEDDPARTCAVSNPARLLLREVCHD